MLLLTLPLMTGCAGMGWQDVLTGIPMGGDVRGEITRVDERSRLIAVRGSWGGGETVRYDSRTRVIYRDRNYRVRDLERGDLVSIDVDSESRGRSYARTVRVERSVRDTRGRAGERRVERFNGQVAWVDRNRGQFGVEMGRYEYTVTIRSRSDRNTARRLDRLRRGNRVRFEGEELGRRRITLHRFL